MKQVKRAPETTYDLDLLVLLAKAISFFRHYGKPVGGVALAGMLAGGLLFWRSPNIYTFSMVVQPVLLTDDCTFRGLGCTSTHRQRHVRHFR